MGESYFHLGFELFQPLLLLFKAIYRSDEVVPNLAERIKLLQDVCVFGNCLPSFVVLSMDDAQVMAVGRGGGQAKIKLATRGDGTRFAIREDRILKYQSGHRKWLLVQVGHIQLLLSSSLLPSSGYL